MQRDAKNSASAPSGRDSQRPRNRQSSGHRKRLQRSSILRGYSAFSRVLSGGRTFSIPPIRLFVRHLPDQPRSVTVGFAVSRSVRTAAKRNRAKRLMREAYRLNQSLWTNDTTPGIEAVWMFMGDPSSGLTFAGVEEAVRELMKKATPPRP